VRGYRTPIDKGEEKKRKKGRGKEDTPYTSTSDKSAQAKRRRNKGDNEGQEEKEDDPQGQTTRTQERRGDDESQSGTQAINTRESGSTRVDTHKEEDERSNIGEGEGGKREIHCFIYLFDFILISPAARSLTFPTGVFARLRETG
jgi:hypothetical protein